MFTYDERVGSRLFCDGLIALARELPIILVENDTGSALEANRFAEALPDRFVNCGIAEANSICISSGLSATGFIPVVHSHAPFITRRCYDQLYLSIGYAGQNCKVIGTTPGIYSELNGGTHLSIVDAAIMRDIPRFKVVDACDNVALEALLPQVMRDPDPTYFRFVRSKPIRVYDEGTQIVMGKANCVREGRDVTIFANNLMVAYAVAAAEMLASEGIDAAVYDMHTIKPIDEEAVVSACRRGPVVTAENGSIIGGLGSAVAEVMAESGCGGKLVRVGIRDRYGVVGRLEEIAQMLHVQPQDIADGVKKALAK